MLWGLLGWHLGRDGMLLPQRPLMIPKTALGRPCAWVEGGGRHQGEGKLYFVEHPPCGRHSCTPCFTSSSSTSASWRWAAGPGPMVMGNIALFLTSRPVSKCLPTPPGHTRAKPHLCSAALQGTEQGAQQEVSLSVAWSWGSGTSPPKPADVGQLPDMVVGLYVTSDLMSHQKIWRCSRNSTEIYPRMD